MQKNRGAINGMWIAAGAVGLVILLIIGASITNTSGVSTAVGAPTSWKIGPDTAVVKVVEFGDFQCPACAAYYGLVKEIEKSFPNDLQVQFKHFPLLAIHPHALNAARAAEAAGKQGKFWEMHDMLYEKQIEWSKLTDARPAFEGYAKELGLNLDQFKSDAKKSDGTDGGINADIKEATALGVNSTPTFYINGVKVIDNPKSIEDFKKLIRDAGGVEVPVVSEVVPAK